MTCMVFQKVYVCSACDCSIHIGAHSIGFVCVHVCHKFKSLGTGSQVFTLPMLFNGAILHTM